MELNKLTTQIASRANPNITFDINLMSDDEGVSCDALYEALIDTFKEDLKNNKIKLSKNVTATLEGSLHFKGIILWDSVPVTDLSIKFDKNDDITEIRATFFTFKGFEHLSDLANVDKLVPSTPSCRKQTVTDNLKDRLVTYVQYVNAVKIYSIGLDNNVYITLDIRPNIKKTMDDLLKNASLSGKTGLPIIIRDRLALGVEPISCNNMSSRNLKETNEDCVWKYESPVFVDLPIGLFAIQKIALKPHESVSKGSFPQKCNAIYLKLTGNEEDMKALKIRPSGSSMLKLFKQHTLAEHTIKDYLTNYNNFSKTNDVIFNPNEEYDLAIILKENSA